MARGAFDRNLTQAHGSAPTSMRKSSLWDSLGKCEDRGYERFVLHGWLLRAIELDLMSRRQGRLCRAAYLKDSLIVCMLPVAVTLTVSFGPICEHKPVGARKGWLGVVGNMIGFPYHDKGIRDNDETS